VATAARSIDPGKIQVALHLHRAELMNAREISARLKCPETLIEELLDRFEWKRGRPGEAKTAGDAKRVAFDPLKVARQILSDESRDSLPHASRAGPGRRFTSAEKAAIAAAIRNGNRPGEIRAEFHCTLDPILRIRRQMGLYRDCRRKPQVSDDVRAQVLKLLPNYSVRKIQGMVGLSQRRVRAIAAAVGGSAVMKVSGSGRRLTADCRQQILESLRAGVPKVEIKRAIGVSLETIQKLRRQLGDLHDLRKDHKLTAVEVAEIRAALASHTSTWKQLAKQYAVGLSTIGSVYRGEKGYPSNDQRATSAEKFRPSPADCDSAANLCLEQGGQAAISHR
jgi:hypothetical protein